MARKYTRDKRGRFASTGATARGARLGGGGRGKIKVAAGRGLEHLKSRAAQGRLNASTSQYQKLKNGLIAAGQVEKFRSRNEPNKADRKPSAGGKMARKPASIASRKAAMVKQVSAAALSGKKVSSARKSYVRAQQSEKNRLASTGKGNAARRRMKR